VIRFDAATDALLDIHRDLETHELAAVASDSKVPILFIVEGIDASVARFLQDRLRATDFPTPERLSFLDDYLDALPWYNYFDVEPHLPPLRSIAEKQEHCTFQFISCREFGEKFHLGDDRLIPDDPNWPYGRVGGGMNAVQRKEVSGRCTSFAPIALVRHHLTTWFDVRADGSWKTGKP
jgi:hypothetical protein